MEQDYTVTINFSEYKKLQDERVALSKEVALLTLEKINLKFQLALCTSKKINFSEEAV
jgi:hypothetical protein